MDEDIKRCGHCELDKPIGDFYNDASRYDGKAHTCKACMKEYADAHKDMQKQRSKKWYEDNKEYANAKNAKWKIDNREHKLELDRAYRERNAEHIKELQKAWHEKHKDTQKTKARTYHLKTKFGLSEKQFDSLMKAQHNACAVCRLTFDLTVKVLSPHVDHCHNAGHVRGLLCGNCNSAEGLLGSIDNVKSLLKYMQKNALFYGA
jgi:hypothetical protein